MPRRPVVNSYFQTSVKFFHEYSWIYDFKATQILSESVVQSVPCSFQEYFLSLDENSCRFREIISLLERDDWPVGVNEFIKGCIHLKRLSEELKDNANHAANFCATENVAGSHRTKLPKKWNPKKYAEVVEVGNVVGEKCKLEKCDAVIDIGSGLGYLSSYIASQLQIPVIGVESDSSKVRTAMNEVEGSSSLQKFVCLRITEGISQEIGPFVEKYDRVCITALHACGDLTPWSLKHFISSKNCKMVAVVPCCYHKMSLDAANFPMSMSLKAVLNGYQDTSFVKNQWLWRLASQRSGDKFLNDIDKETKNLFFRAILEKVCAEESLNLKRRKRKLHCSTFKSFTEYLNKILGEKGSFDLFKGECKINEDDLENVKTLMMVEYGKLIPWSRTITGILALQGALQKVAEDFILIDRLVYMEEIDEVRESGLIKVIPDEVSPRGMVLFGIKND